MNARAVFDCMIFVQAVTNESGPAFACFQYVEEGRLTLCLSHEILAEVRDVLSRPKVRRKFTHLTEERIEEFLRVVETRGVIREVVPSEFTYARDPDDEPYINLAIAAGASYLVSRDNDLLDLMTDPEFRARYSTLAIVDPVSLLGEIRASEAMSDPDP